MLHASPSFWIGPIIITRIRISYSNILGTNIIVYWAMSRGFRGLGLGRMVLRGCIGARFSQELSYVTQCTNRRIMKHTLVGHMKCQWVQAFRKWSPPGFELCEL